VLQLNVIMIYHSISSLNSLVINISSCFHLMLGRSVRVLLVFPLLLLFCCTYLLAPKQQRLYPWPHIHPGRQASQVNFNDVDHAKFPNFNGVVAYEALLGPSTTLTQFSPFCHGFDI
jgi:hypothetical protein